jgi:uncharacterized protein YutE (UPF0331/DUF86 family)
MVPEVITRKLDFVRTIRAELQRFSGASLAEVLAAHLTVERIFVLLVTAASDLLRQLLLDRGIVARSPCEALARAAEIWPLSAGLVERLVKASEVREMVVHRYDEIDYDVLRSSIDPALADFATLIAVLEVDLPAADE